MNRALFLLLFCCLISLGLKAKDSTRLQVFPFPVVYYLPETRWAFGAGAGITFLTDTLSRQSSLFPGAAYTLNKQILLYASWRIFSHANRWFWNGEAGYYRYNYFYFGAGEKEVPAELYAVNFPRFRFQVSRQIAGNNYLGPLLHYEAYRMKSVIPGGELQTGNVPGAAGSEVLATGLGWLADTRDDVFYPTSGYLLQGAVWHNVLEPYRFTRVTIDHAHYFRLFPKGIMAFNAWYSYTRGNAPFHLLSFLGGARRLRGFYEGRYRDDQALVLQAEFRYQLTRRFGVTLFGGTGALGAQDQFLRWKQPYWTAGGGLRFRTSLRNKLNLRLDYGIGPGSSAFYLTLAEAF